LLKFINNLLKITTLISCKKKILF